MSKTTQGQNNSQQDYGSLNKISNTYKISTLKKAVIKLREERLNYQKLYKNQHKRILIQLRKRQTQMKNTILQLLNCNYKSKFSTLTKIKQEILLQIILDYLKLLSKMIHLIIMTIQQIKQSNFNKLKQKQDDHEALLLIIQIAYKEFERDQKQKDYQIDKLTKERIKELSAERLQFQLKLKTIEKIIQQQEDETKVLKKGLDDCRFKIAQLLSELEEISGKLLQYKLTLNNQILDIECLFIPRQNLFQEYIFELETSAQRFVYKACMITDLKIKDDQSFYLTIKSRSRDEVFKLGHGQDVKNVQINQKFIIKSIVEPCTLAVQYNQESQKQQSFWWIDINIWKDQFKEWKQYQQ
ncbi:unnamed protein product [Paramecium pentaurelia]|uniref:Uncharacterized protein n=1 Tax=Paramecium pentaurelia TaxID=43138 RepID=A0A8S1TCG3_9CILI|nr:unnamed protein product [Paramecium pentaurelia]